jgi:hypothetical protein
MLELEKIAYHLFVRGVFSKRNMKKFIKQGFIHYVSAFLYDTLDKDLAFINNQSDENKWEYDNWEQDFSSRDKRLNRELFLLFESQNFGDEVEKEQFIRSKPKTIELKTLLKSVAIELEEKSELFNKSLMPILPTSQNWQQAARIISDMQQDSLLEKVVEYISKTSGAFLNLWNFLEYDGYLFPDYSGPIIAAYKKLTSGVLKSQFGQYHWALEHPEFHNIYEVVQAKISISRVFSQIFFKKEKLFLRMLKKEYHPLAYSSAVLLRSAKRWKEKAHKPPSSNEEFPYWIPIEELASPIAWATAWQMDPYLVDDFLYHYFEITYEKSHSLNQVLLRSFYEYSNKFEKNVDQCEFVEKIRTIVKEPENEKFKKEEIFKLQHKDILNDNYWGPFFKALPKEKWYLFLGIWWENFVWQALGLGCAWIKEEERWDRRIIEYEAYVDEETFNEQIDPLIKDFYSIFSPAKWNIT